MSELLAEVHEMRLEMKGMREEQVKTNVAIGELRTAVGELRGEQAKTNLAIGELWLSVMKLADFGGRILRLEKEVFKKAS